MFINQQLKNYFIRGQHFDRVYYSLQLEFVSFLLGNFRNINFFLCFIRVDCSVLGSRLIAESFLNFFLSTLGQYSVSQV